MRQYDLSPLFRSTVGFDRLFSMLDGMSGVDNGNGYPPYNIERTGEDTYRITMAVAGFSEADLAIETTENLLTVKGEKTKEPEDGVEYLHRGIAARAFERRFQLADHVIVTGARLEHGLLHLSLKREIPDTKKPRRIEISQAAAAGQPKVVEHQA